MIRILDTTLRDGEQAPGFSMNPAEKVRMALQLEALGVDFIEAGFPAASKGDAESVRAVAQHLTKAGVVALARATKGDVTAAAAAIKGAAHPRIHVFLATSDIHLKYKLHISRQTAIARITESVSYAKSFCPDVEFSAEDASRTEISFLCRAVAAAIAAGATVVNLPDTVGYATPDEMRRMITAVLEGVPGARNVVLSVHCHDDLGLAVANTLSGIEAGAGQAECTLAGIGERAGNAALEEVVMGLRTRADHYGVDCGVRSEEIYRSVRLLTSITGVNIFPSKAIVGRNAFAHEAGVHQHGLIANAKTYEIMTPESVGIHDTSLILGKHSGRHAFAHRLVELGYDLAEPQVDDLFAAFKALTDRKKNVTDKDIVALAESKLNAVGGAEEQWVLDHFVVNSGNLMTSTGCVTLRRGSKKYEEVAIGNGPIYATFSAVEKIIKHQFFLEDYQLQAVTERRDALAEARVKISDPNGIYRGRGVSTDVIEASLLACLAAVNRMLA